MGTINSALSLMSGALDADQAALASGSYNVSAGAVASKVVDSMLDSKS